MAKSQKKKKKSNQKESDAPKSEAKLALEEAVEAVQKGKPYNLDTTEKQPLRNVGTTVYVKTQDLDKFKEKIQDQIESDNNQTAKDLSRLEQAQTRTTQQIEGRVKNLYKISIVIAVLVLLLIGVVIWLIITTSSLSTQIANRTSNGSNGTSIAKIIPDHEINLSEQDTDITLNEDGDYLLSGKTTHKINITASDVTLNLNGIDMTVADNSAINYKSDKTLNINLLSGSKNTLTSSGAGVDGGTIHSSGYINITGDGTLETYGTDKYGNGIMAKQHYSINDGNVLALGADMIEKPTSSQKSLSFDLSEIVHSGSTVQIRNQRGAVIYSFVATQDFRTLIWSTPNLSDGSYSLYVNDKNIKTIKI